MKMFAILSAVLLLATPLSGYADEAKEAAAKQAANEWLTLLDNRQYEASWKAAASVFRARIDSAKWVQMAASVRAPLGTLVERNLISATYTTTLPGVPDGEYVVLQYQTKFVNKAAAVETVTPMLDAGHWRVAGYYIR